MLSRCHFVIGSNCLKNRMGQVLAPLGHSLYRQPYVHPYCGLKAIARMKAIARWRFPFSVAYISQCSNCNVAICQLDSVLLVFVLLASRQLHLTMYRQYPFIAPIHFKVYYSFRNFENDPSASCPILIEPTYRSQRKIFSVAFNWDIANFDKRVDSSEFGEVFDSEHFDCGGVKWFLRLHPHGYSSESSGGSLTRNKSIGLFLGKVNKNQIGKTSISSKFHFFILNRYNQRVFGRK